ncbi:hypothetical protein GOP47_0015734 [Adiantum capillus-veneris]|uniref:ARM repeat superfamily protein n=1 Tax=Adiantum capillus-veneris TaxID=13818 RepID=A0A9D4UK74_ADICA|nr:hypothetical protein GOP47_0015734 [Adiantum capillus-veneris]
METAITMDVDGLDLSALRSDASLLYSTPGLPSDAVADQFLNRYPLPALFRALEAGDELKNTLIPTLEKIFNTQAGGLALLQSLPYAAAGLETRSPSIRRMTCLGISKLIERSSDNEATLQALVSSNLTVLLLNTVTDRDESVASAGMEAIQNLAKTSFGTSVLFTGKQATAERLKDLVFNGQSLVRIRIFSIIASLFKTSKQVVLAIEESGVLRGLELELCNKDDVLAQMNALELLHEIALTSDGANFVVNGGLLQRLISTMGSTEVDPLVRSQSMMVAARLISPEGSGISVVPKLDAMSIVTSVNTYLRTLESSQIREREAAIDALGRIGMSKGGAELLLEASSGAALIIKAALGQKGGSEQLVSFHALAFIGGSERTEGPLLSNQAEELLRDLIFAGLNSSSRHSISELIQWLLQQAYETRLAVYRLIVPFAARSWFLRDVCSNDEVVNFLTDPHSEQSKEGMEWRHACCVAISTSLRNFDQVIQTKLQEVLEKFQTAVMRGPYLARDKPEARPLVVTQERF